VGIQKQITTKPKDLRSSPKKDKEPRSLLESKGPKSELDKKVSGLCAFCHNMKNFH